MGRTVLTASLLRNTAEGMYQKKSHKGSIFHLLGLFATNSLLYVQVEPPAAYVCADGKIYDATEWYICQVRFSRLTV